MRCYYRNGIICGANIREFEDQSVIKEKLDQLGVSFWGFFWRTFREERNEEKKKKKRKKAKKGMDISLFHF